MDVLHLHSPADEMNSQRSEASWFHSTLYVKPLGSVYVIERRCCMTRLKLHLEVSQISVSLLPVVRIAILSKADSMYKTNILYVTMTLR